jgi:hypothetical protein
MQQNDTQKKTPKQFKQKISFSLLAIFFSQKGAFFDNVFKLATFMQIQADFKRLKAYLFQFMSRRTLALAGFQVDPKEEDEKSRKKNVRKCDYNLYKIVDYGASVYHYLVGTYTG